VGHPAYSSLPDDAGVVGRLVANRYLIEEACERSPVSAIYRARHLLDGSAVLLRVLGGHPRFSHGHCRDALGLAERASSLPSPHVARTLDVGVVAERWPFIVSEYTKGRTLAAVLEHEGPFALRRLVPIARVIASTMAMAHGAGVLHGELRPCGIWLESPSGRPEWVRLLDFGIRLLRDRAVEASHSGVYRSTSLMDATPISQAAVQSEVQALGSLLHELLLGSKGIPGANDLAGLLDARGARAAWAGDRELVRSFAKIVSRCLTSVPEAAYRSMGEVCRDLEILAQALSRIPPGPAERRPPVTVIHAPARRAHVALGGPKVIVRGG
jgi:serine/threonine protein kinase